MPHFDQEPFDLRCEWGLEGLQGLAASDVIVIVDVLSFTTCVDIAVARGACVLPYPLNDLSALQYAERHGAELAGRRGDRGSRYSLSPSSLADLPAGLRLVLPSPNGSHLAFSAGERATAVIAGCLRNAAAVAAWAAQRGTRIAVIPAGERWPDGSLRPCVEDLLGAGAILRELPGRRSPEADLAVAAFEECAGNLGARIAGCSSGRELVEKGYAADVQIATELNVSNGVPVLKDGAFSCS
ncbi:MAG TPA: 2-phosphosulfolactate phosphatase [Tepidisphaeraceae bacterium]|jgi:2-phosphosulfolactate phosphatase|nr:2-phosphosulfolactate phosphatase [Tepidisphaeraceae bacterium]